MTVKMPEPMTAPMPSAVSDQGPRVFLRELTGSSDSRISLSIDLQATSWRISGALLSPPGGDADGSEFTGTVREEGGDSRSIRLIHYPGQTYGRMLRAEPCGQHRGQNAQPEPSAQAEPGSQENTPARVRLTQRLALRLAACQLLDPLLVRTTRGGALGLRSGLLAGCALQLLPFDFVFNLGGIGHG